MLKIFQDPSVGFRYRSVRMELKHEALIMQKLSFWKILWPENWPRQGRTHAAEKLENDENDGKSRFLRRFRLEIDPGSSLRESLKDTCLVETVETDNKAAV